LIEKFSKELVFLTCFLLCLLIKMNWVCMRFILPRKAPLRKLL
jgi:hypothetical protein